MKLVALEALLRPVEQLDMKVVLKLTEALGVDISANGVRSMWLRNNMNTTALRVERSQVLQESA